MVIFFAIYFLYKSILACCVQFADSYFADSQFSIFWMVSNALILQYILAIPSMDNVSYDF